MNSSNGRKKIKAIETQYKGFRFRSRLEARWAVFFDALKIEWLFEPEGYALETKAYLPDFFLPQFKCWIEIKPESAKEDLQQPGPLFNLMEEFSLEVGPIICFPGMPSMSWSGMLFCQDLTESSGGAYSNLAGFAWCHICQKPSLSIADTDSRFLDGGRVLCDNEFNAWDYNFCDPQHRSKHSIGEIQDAVYAARAARFEHGE